MSNDRGRRPKKHPDQLPKLRSSDGDDYEVGYRKPPKRNQFQRGVSGNPSGRPRGSKNLRPALREDQLTKLIFQEANRKVKISEGGRTRQITMAEAILRSLMAKAAQGHRLHQKLFLDLYSQSEASRRERDGEVLDTVINYKRQAERVLEHCKATGEKPPDLIIPPDNIHIDMETGEITITGLTAWDRKAEDKKLRYFQEVQRQEIICFKRELEKTEDPEMRKSIEGEIENAKEMLSWLTQILGDEELGPTKQR
jgi:hypothetical protein